MEQRKLLELQHNKKILDAHNEAIWGWDSAAGKLRLQRRADLINNFLKSQLCATKNDNKKVLELGCGTGIFTERLFSPASGLAVSLDIYNEFIFKSVQRIKKTGKKHAFLVGDAENLPFLDKSFDAVMGVSILHHLQLGIAVKSISRILKPGGIFIFSEPNMLNPQIFIQKNIPFVKRCLGDSPYERALSPFGLKRIFLGSNLKVEMLPFDFLHPALPKNLIPLVAKLGGCLERCAFLKYTAGSLLIYGKKI